MASIKDVAKFAGVSIGTVSRAYNGYSDIKCETKERIFEAAKILHYVPNANARSLSSKVTNNIGVIIPELVEGDNKDNHTFQVLKGIYQFIQENNYQISLYAVDSKKQKKRSYSEFCMEHNIEGVITHGIAVKDFYFKELIDSKIPCVTIDLPIANKNVGYVTIDNVKASKELMNYVIHCNHRNIVIIAGKKGDDITIKKLSGAAESLYENGIKVKTQSILYCDFQEQIAYQKVINYLQNKKNRKATLFFCQSDIMALGVYKALYSQGYSIPDDFSVVGFDGIAMIDYITPSLTSIKKDMIYHGYRAAELLTRIIKNPTEDREIIIDYEILIHNSVKVLN